MFPKKLTRVLLILGASQLLQVVLLTIIAIRG